MNQSPRRLLVVSPLCHRDDLGEASCAFAFVLRLSQRYDVTLLTSSKPGLPPVRDLLPDAHVIAWDEPPLPARAERFTSMLKPGYIAFYWRAKRWIRRALEDGQRFDLAHQIGPLTLRYPSPLGSFDIPYLIGPVGGSLPDPPGFGSEDTAAWFVRLRALDPLRLRRDPVLRRTFARAHAVIGIAPYVQELLEGVGVRRFEVLSDTGVDALPPAVNRGGRKDPVRLLYVGRVIRTKGLRDLLRAMAQVPDVVLHVAGDGYDRPACETLLDDLGLRDRVTMLGRVPHVRVTELYQEADVFVFPSYREPGGLVVTEALSQGLPVIVCDRGGPGFTVDNSCGIRVALRGGPQEYADDLADALRRLAGSASLRAELGRGARARIEQLSLWDRKVDQLEQWYLEALTD